MSKVVLIDGHSILNRAFYGVPELTNSKGLHTNAVYGFLNIMFRVIEDEKADHLAVAFDLKEPTFRHKMYEAYKGTRKPMPEELREQVPVIKEVLSAMGIPICSLPGYEADDVLGTIAGRCAAAGAEVAIVSGDRDLLQLADEHVKIRMPKTTRGGTEIKDYYPADVKEQYQVTPKEFVDVKALMGDASDNIPGVPSIGEKTATALITAYGSIENAYAHIDEVKPPRAQKALREHYDMAQMSKELALICTDCPIEFSMEEAKMGNLYTPEAYQLLSQLEFKSLLLRFDADSRAENQEEKQFRAVSNLEEAAQLFERARKNGEAGVQLAVEAGEVLALGLAFGEQDIYCIHTSDTISGEYLTEQLNRLAEGGAGLSFLDLKSQLPFLPAADRLGDCGEDTPDSRQLFDAGVAGYLLNPLKDTYDYDDLARDYLDMTVPSKGDLIGKQSFGDIFSEITMDLGQEASENGKEELNSGEQCLCYMAYTAWKSREKLTEKLKETGMEELFFSIEMPLIYSLFHMEQAGICVKREELQAYGERLRGQIETLEQEIYQGTGEVFNINSQAAG